MPLLYEERRGRFDRDYAPSAPHRVLAALPGAIRRWHGADARYPLIITTNSDDALEAAFRAVNEPFDLVTYVAKGKGEGRFLHSPWEGEPRMIERGNVYTGLSLEKRTVVLKIHGAVLFLGYSLRDWNLRVILHRLWGDSRSRTS